MLIALLAVLGVDLVVIVALAAIVVARRRWLKRQPGEFAGAIRVTSGDVRGLGPTWKRGSGRWVRDVLVWNTASSCSAPNSSSSISATIEVAARDEHRFRLRGPFVSRTGNSPEPGAGIEPPASARPEHP